MNILGIIAGATGILPLIQTIISGVESLFGGGNGPTKLEAATNATIAALQAYLQLTGKTVPAGIESDIKDAINANVKVMNDLGLLLPAGSPGATAAAVKV